MKKLKPSFLLLTLLLSLVLTKAQNLTVERAPQAVAVVGDKVLFGGGYNYGGYFSNRVEIYDDASSAWSFHDLESHDLQTIVTGGKALFFPANTESDRLDIFDAASGAWSQSVFPKAVSYPSAFAAGNKVFFHSGYYFENGQYTYDESVMVYDVQTGAWSVRDLGRTYPTVSQVLNKVVFVGGQIPPNFLASGAVDSYDLEEDSWTMASLSVTRYYPGQLVVGDKLILAGGFTDTDNSAVVDIYNASTNGWTQQALSSPSAYSSTVVVGSSAFFIGGYGSNFLETADVHIYNADLDEWSSTQMSQARSSTTVVVVDDEVLITGGEAYDPNTGNYLLFDEVDIYDVASSAWSSAQLSEARRYPASFVKNGRVVFVGGMDIYGAPFPQVDVYDSFTGEWTSLLSENANFRTGLTDSKLYLAGGKTFLPNGLSRPTGTVDVFDFVSGTWSQTALPSQRVGLGMAALPGKIMLAGGRTEIAPGILHKMTNIVDIIED